MKGRLTRRLYIYTDNKSPEGRSRANSETSGMSKVGLTSEKRKFESACSVKFIQRRSTCAELVTLQTSSSSHRNCDSSTLAMARGIRYTRSRRNRDIGGWYIWSITYPRTQKSHGVRSGDLDGLGMGPARPIESNIAPLSHEVPYCLDSYRSAILGANELHEFI
jgi:hypothetical protein